MFLLHLHYGPIKLSIIRVDYVCGINTWICGAGESVFTLRRSKLHIFQVYNGGVHVNFASAFILVIYRFFFSQSQMPSKVGCSLWHNFYCIKNKLFEAQRCNINKIQVVYICPGLPIT